MKISGFLNTLLVCLLVSCQPAEEPTVESHRNTMASPDELYGQLFVDVQMNRVFPDGKTFVDCVPKISPEEIVKKYQEQKDQPGFDLKTFVLENFDLPKQHASGFHSDSTKTVVEHINSLWPVLTRQPDEKTAGTLIPLPYPYIVPGGRFGEIYYWDSYFTLQGLQAAGETDMVRNMVANFAYLIDTIGFIPNGNRTYYLGRSQPPFFAAMVNLLAETDGDSTLVKYLPQLEKEHAFWMDGADGLTGEKPAYRRVVRLGDGMVLNRYWDDNPGPRPESYREDVETAKRSGRPVDEMYRHLRACAESGWDFCSRWFADGKTLETIRTTDMIPVDLNALLFNLEKTIAKAHRIAGNEDKATEFEQKAKQRSDAVQRYLWHPPSEFYMDFDFRKGEPTYVPSLAASYPLYFNMATPEQAQQVAKTLQGDFLRAGGVTSTLNNTGQQWDAPNGWAPLHWMTIKGLRNYGFNELADTISQRWLELNTKVYRNTGKMVEKYNVQDLSLDAGGGEYPVQDGFGWSNGVFLRLKAGGEK